MAGLDAFGTALQRSDMATTPVFTEVANVTNISGPSISRATHDVSAHDSPDGYMEFIGGLRDGGEVSIDLNYDPQDTTHQNFTTTDLDEADPRDYKIVFPDLSEFDFSAVLTSFDVTASFDDKLTGTAAFKITGKPTFTPGI